MLDIIIICIAWYYFWIHTKFEYYICKYTKYLYWINLADAFKQSDLLMTKTKSNIMNKINVLMDELKQTLKE